MYRRVLRGEPGHAKVEHAHDRLGQSEMEHVHAVSNLRPQQGRAERELVRPQGVQPQRVRGQDRAQDRADLSRAGQRGPGRGGGGGRVRPTHNARLSHEQRLEHGQDHAQDEHQHLPQPHNHNHKLSILYHHRQFYFFFLLFLINIFNSPSFTSSHSKFILF